MTQNSMLSYVIGNYQYCCVYSTQSRRLTPCSFFLKHNFQKGWIGKTSIDSYYHRVFKKKNLVIEMVKNHGRMSKGCPFCMDVSSHQSLPLGPFRQSSAAWNARSRCNSFTIDLPTVFKIKSGFFAHQLNIYHRCT